MCLTEYDEAETMNMFKEEGRREGYEDGRRDGLANGRREGEEERKRLEAENEMLKKKIELLESK